MDEECFQCRTAARDGKWGCPTSSGSALRPKFAYKPLYKKKKITYKIGVEILSHQFLMSFGKRSLSVILLLHTPFPKVLLLIFQLSAIPWQQTIGNVVVPEASTRRDWYS